MLALFLRACTFLSEHDLALINKRRRPAKRLGFAVLLCYLRESGFPLHKSISSRDGVVLRLAAHLKLQSDLWAKYASIFNDIHKLVALKLISQ